MSNPFTVRIIANANSITGPQRSFLRDLMIQKARLAQLDMAEAEAKLDPWLDGLTSSQAHDHIDATKAAIADLRAMNMTKPEDVGIDGFWELPDGRIAKVQMAVNGSGNPYAKIMDVDTGKFNYASGLITEVRNHGTRLPLERAKDLGKLYGICVCCGRTLTDEGSIAAGIGPICATRF